MKAIRGATGTGGIFLLYEPTRRAGEDRAAWLDRFVRTKKPSRRVLTPPEWDQIWHHVSACDFPETAAVWCELGREAAFAKRGKSSSILPTSSSCSASKHSAFATAAAECARKTEALALYGLGRLPRDPRPEVSTGSNCAQRWAQRGPIKSDQPVSNCPTGMVYVEVNFMEHRQHASHGCD
jgi:hypothetical protein